MTTEIQKPLPSCRGAVTWFKRWHGQGLTLVRSPSRWSKSDDC